MWEGYFLIYLRPLIEYGMKGSSKMKCIGITGMPLKLLQNFLQTRHQWVLLNGQCSLWAPIFAGVAQGSILGPLFFWIYINDLTKEISINQQTICWWYLHFFYWKSYWCFWTWLNSHLMKISMWVYCILPMCIHLMFIFLFILQASKFTAL